MLEISLKIRTEIPGIATQLTWKVTFKLDIWDIKANNRRIAIKKAVFFYFKDAKFEKVIPYISPTTPRFELMGANLTN